MALEEAPSLHGDPCRERQLAGLEILVQHLILHIGYIDEEHHFVDLEPLHSEQVAQSQVAQPWAVARDRGIQHLGTRKCLLEASGDG